jgi:hypothetical protein
VKFLSLERDNTLVHAVFPIADVENVHTALSMKDIWGPDHSEHSISSAFAVYKPLKNSIIFLFAAVQEVSQPIRIEMFDSCLQTILRSYLA